MNETDCTSNTFCTYNNNEEGKYCYPSRDYKCNEFTYGNCPTGYGCYQEQNQTDNIAACDGTYFCFD